MKSQDQKVLEKINEIAKTLPRFPDGRIDYTNSKISLVLTVFIKYKNQILLLKRSNKVGTYKERWNTVTGYIDEKKPVFNKIIEEINEELGLSEDIIQSYHYGELFEFTDDILKKTWIVFPAMLLLSKKPNIKLNWEHSEYKWINPNDLKKYHTVPKLEISLEKGIL